MEKTLLAHGLPADREQQVYDYFCGGAGAAPNGANCDIGGVLEDPVFDFILIDIIASGGTGALGKAGFKAAAVKLGSSKAPAKAADDLLGATNTGHLSLNSGSEVNQWAGPTLSRVTQADEVMYRVWGGGSGQAGEWLTPINPASSASARTGLALPGSHAASYVSEVVVPAGTRIQVGAAGGAFSQSGGRTQVGLLEEIPLSSFGKGVPLAP